MTKTLFSMLLAGTIALTSITVPSQARADTDDVAKAVAALIALGLIAKAIDDNNDRKRARKTQPEVITRAPKPHHGNRYGHRRSAKEIPWRCVFNLETAERGYRNVVGPRCLRRHAPQVVLPQACRVTAYTRHGWRPAYGRGCLKRRGYTFI